jgi:hypothetical protein
MNGITIVNIGGELRTLSFKNNFLTQLGITLKCDPLAVDEVLQELKTPMQMMATIIYCGLCAYQDRIGNYTREIVFNEVKQPITIALVSEWIDDADDQEFFSVWDEFRKIMAIPEASEKQIKEYEARIKKKLIPTAKKSKQSQAK